MFGPWSLVLYIHVLAKAKFFLMALTWETYLTFNVSIKTVNEWYVFLMGFIFCLGKLSCCSTRLFKKCFICSRVGILDSPWCNNCCHPYKELGQGGFYYSIRKKLPLQFIYNQLKKMLPRKKIMLISISSIAWVNIYRFVKLLNSCFCYSLQ